METKPVETIDAYIRQFPPEKQAVMLEMRKVIHEEAPEAQEKMSWAMPTFVYYGNLVHFAAHAHHLGFYPGAEAMVAFAGQLSAYKTSKGAVQFPFDAPVPYDLVRQMVRYCMKANKAQAEQKKKK